MKCKLCKSEKTEIKNKLNIRHGSLGNQTKEKFEILFCKNCEVQHLKPFPDLNIEYYSSGEYRSDYTKKDIDVNHYFSVSDNLSSQFANAIGINYFRNKTVADVGCGAGSFLDIIKGVAAKTIAIEPTKIYHNSLEERGHLVLNSLSELKPESCDVITSFDVIEHVQSPLDFIIMKREALKKDGRLFCLTPNSNEILTKLDIDKFDEFYYRTVHLWYFNKKSFQWMAEQAKFSSYDISYLHCYDLSNFALWLKDSIPTGNARTTIFDGRINSQWKSFLEAQGMSDNIWLKAKK